MVLLGLRSFDEILAVEMENKQHRMSQLTRHHTLGSLNSEIIYGSGPITVFNTRQKVSQGKHAEENIPTKRTSHVDLHPIPLHMDPV